MRSLVRQYLLHPYVLSCITLVLQWIRQIQQWYQSQIRGIPNWTLVSYYIDRMHPQPVLIYHNSYLSHTQSPRYLLPMTSHPQYLPISNIPYQEDDHVNYRPWYTCKSITVIEPNDMDTTRLWNDCLTNEWKEYISKHEQFHSSLETCINRYMGLDGLFWDHHHMTSLSLYNLYDINTISHQLLPVFEKKCFHSIHIRVEDMLQQEYSIWIQGSSNQKEQTN